MTAKYWWGSGPPWVVNHLCFDRWTHRGEERRDTWMKRWRWKRKKTQIFRCWNIAGWLQPQSYYKLLYINVYFILLISLNEEKQEQVSWLRHLLLAFIITYKNWVNDQKDKSVINFSSCSLWFCYQRYWGRWAQSEEDWSGKMWQIWAEWKEERRNCCQLQLSTRRRRRTWWDEKEEKNGRKLRDKVVEKREVRWKMTIAL